MIDKSLSTQENAPVLGLLFLWKILYNIKVTKEIDSWISKFKRKKNGRVI